MVGQDQFDFHFWSYENNYIPRLNTSLAGRNTFTFNENTNVDNGITKTRIQADTFNSSTSTDFTIASNGTITTAANTNFNFDEIYDLTKFKKEIDTTSINIPTVSTLSVTSNVGIIDFLNTPTIGGTFSIGSTNSGMIAPTIDLSKITLAGEIYLEATTAFTNLPLNITGGTFKGTYTDATAISTDRTFNFDKNTNTSELTLVFNSSEITTIVNKVASDFASVTNNGSGDIVFDPNDFTQFIIPSTLPGGRCLLKNLTSNTIEFEGEHITGTETVLGKFNNVNTNFSNFRLYYLANAVTTGVSSSRAFYLPSIIDGSNNSSNPANSVFPSFAEHSDLLTGSAEQATTGTETAIMEMTDHNSTTAKIVINGSFDKPLSTARTLRALLLARETIGTDTETHIVNAGNAGTFSDSGTDTGELAADFPTDITGFTQIVINGITVPSSKFSLGDIDIKNLETATITFTESLTSLGLNGLIDVRAQFQRVNTVTEDHNLYIRLLANINSINDLILPSPGNETQIDNERFTLTALTQQQLSAVIFIGNGEKY